MGSPALHLARPPPLERSSEAPQARSSQLRQLQAVLPPLRAREDLALLEAARVVLVSSHPSPLTQQKPPWTQTRHSRHRDPTSPPAWPPAPRRLFSGPHSKLIGHLWMKTRTKDWGHRRGLLSLVAGLALRSVPPQSAERLPSPRMKTWFQPRRHLLWRNQSQSSTSQSPRRRRQTNRNPYSTILARPPRSRLSTSGPPHQPRRRLEIDLESAPQASLAPTLLCSSRAREARRGFLARAGLVSLPSRIQILLSVRPRSRRKTKTMVTT